ncbi:transglycosylase SLT domain-containing protein [Bradyrhizobium sp. STM 3557]|uniref:transglycosylase SLT domain-containing protein n=1 Tax=Bradyrhizobium sp. STM 3557 TaxID=578920 RepID=UPI003890F8A4
MKRPIRALAFVSVIGASLPAFASDVRDAVNSAADAQGILRAIAHAVVKVESNYNCHLRGNHGERGIMQVKPETARSVGVTGNLFDCATGLRAGRT